MMRAMTKKTALLFVAAFALGCAVTAATSAPRGELAAAFEDFTGRIAPVESHVRQSPSFGSPAEQAAGYLHMARSLISALETEVLQDVDYPYFRTLDFWLRGGGDNTDQRYAFSRIRGGATYRIWGSLGSAKRIEFQMYAGEPWDGSGRSVGYLAFEDIEIAKDGSFDLVLSAEARTGNWMNNPPEATSVFARHIYDDWNDATPGHVHIDRVGYEGRRRPSDMPDDLARRFRAAADRYQKIGTAWPDFVNRRYVDAGPANVLSPLVDTYKLGGAKGRWMATGHFEVPDGKALVIKTFPTSAQYQGIQLTDMWFQSLEAGNQVSSLTTRQALLSPDGAYYFVVSAGDPGHANWLDPGAFQRGTMLLRFDGVRGEIPADQHPSTQLVDFADLPDVIPGYSKVSAADRDAVRRARRQHLQLRSGR